MSEDVSTIDTGSSGAPPSAPSSTPADTGAASSAPASPSKSELLASSSRAAIEQAFADVGVGETEEALSVLRSPDKKPQPRDDKQRFQSPDPEKQRQLEAQRQAGQQKPDAQQADIAPPDRFAPEAKALWEQVPAPVRAEIDRSVRELTSGLEQYKAQAEQFADLRDYHRMAQEAGTTIKASIDNWLGLQNLVSSDIVTGLRQIADSEGYDLEDVARFVLGIPDDAEPQEGYNQSGQEVARLKEVLTREATAREQQARKIEMLERQLYGFSQQQTVAQQNEIRSKVEAFRAAPGHERFVELEGRMAQLISTGMAADLDEAYQLADRMNPLPQVPAPSRAARDPADQTRKGVASISGSPGAGSNPAALNGRRITSSGDAVREAFRTLGSA